MLMIFHLSIYSTEAGRERDMQRRGIGGFLRVVRYTP